MSDAAKLASVRGKLSAYKATSPHRICASCVHHLPPTDGDDSVLENVRCGRVDAIDVVSGYPFKAYAHSVRGDEALCGITGKWFEATP